jgi:hypothetical protein
MDSRVKEQNVTRPILTLKKKSTAAMPPATEAPKSALAKTQQEAPQQPQKKNKDRYTLRNGNAAQTG